MRGLITPRHEPRLSFLPGVSVCSEEHGHAPKYTLLSRRLRRFIYLLDSCPELLARFSTGAESPTKHAASCRTPAHPRNLARRPSAPAGPGPALLAAAFWVAGRLSGSLSRFFSFTAPGISSKMSFLLYPQLLLRISSLAFCPCSFAPRFRAACLLRLTLSLPGVPRTCLLGGADLRPRSPRSTYLPTFRAWGPSRARGKPALFTQPERTP